jgi:hypothetical protein
MEKEEKIVVQLSNEELDAEIERMRALPIKRDIKRNARRVKKEKSPEELQAELMKTLGISQDELLKYKLKTVLGGGN